MIVFRSVPSRPSAPTPVEKMGTRELAMVARLVAALLAPLANLARIRIIEALERPGRRRRERAREAAEVVDLAPMRDRIAEAMVEPLAEAMRDGAGRTASKLDVDFTLTPSDAIRWAEQRAAELVVEIDQASRDAVRQTVTTALREGRSVLDTAAEVRGAVGLHSRWANAVARHRQRLVDEGRNPEQVERMTAKYQERLVRARARNIARTELLRASNAGALETYRRAEALGALVAPLKRWVTAHDERLCPLCAPLDGVEVEGLDTPFPNSAVLMPPLHPSCRCRGVVRVGEARLREVA